MFQYPSTAKRLTLDYNINRSKALFCVFFCNLFSTTQFRKKDLEKFIEILKSKGVKEHEFFK